MIFDFLDSLIEAIGDWIWLLVRYVLAGLMVTLLFMLAVNALNDGPRKTVDAIFCSKENTR